MRLHPQQQSFETFAEVESLKPQDFAQQHENGGPEHKDGTRPPSGSTRSRPQSALGRVSTSPPHLTVNEGSSSLGANKPTVSDQMAVETKGSRPSSARSHSDSTHGRSLDSAEAPGPSRQAVREGMHSLCMYNDTSSVALSFLTVHA